MFNEKRICVVGLGYIGLPTASLLATKGYEVHGVDVQPHVVEIINAGEIHIKEPELDVLVRSAVRSGRFKASTVPINADIFVLAVPTPFKEGYLPDLKYVEDAARAVAPYLKKGDLLILESTSPVGTTEKIADWVAEERPDINMQDLHIAHCPERVLPGQIIKELVSNDRIVGGVNDASTQAAADFYRTFVSGNILTTDSRTAELVKLAENTFRDVNIALANEFSLICDRLNINVWELIKLANHHPRVNILQPGPGVGGHCIAVDPWFIVDSAPDLAQLIKTAREVNDGKSHYVLEKITHAAEHVQDPVVACLGLAFKPDVDDLRESPALEIVHELQRHKIGQLLVVEPNIKHLPPILDASSGVELVSLDEAINKANIVVMLVNHREFYEIPKNKIIGKEVIDTRGVWQ